MSSFMSCFDGWVLGAASPLAGLVQPLDAPTLLLSILTLARPFCCGPKMRRHLLSPLSVPSSLRTCSSSAALPVGTCSLLTGPRQPPPLLVPDQGTFSPRPRLAPKSWPLGSKVLPLSQPKTMSGQQNNLPHTGAPGSQSPNVWVHWLFCRQPSPGPPARAACILGPRCAPPHAPPSGQSLLLRVLGLVPNSWALFAKEAETERCIQIGKKEEGLESRQRKAFVGMALDGDRGSCPSSALTLAV